MGYNLLFFIALIIGIVASYFDLKDRLVPDHLHYILFFSGLSYKIILFKETFYLPVLYSTGIAILFFTLFSLLLYKNDAFAGADFKHLIAYSTVLPYVNVGSLMLIVLVFVSTMIIVSFLYFVLLNLIGKMEKETPFIPVFPICLAISCVFYYLK